MHQLVLRRWKTTSCMYGLFTLLPAPALPAAGLFCEVGVLTVKLSSVVAVFEIVWLHSYQKWY